MIMSQVIFWKYYRFKDAVRTFITLFGLANGDAMNDIFQSVKEAG